MKPNIFISHQWKYNAEYHSLIEKFDNLGWKYVNYCVPEHDPLDVNSKRRIELALQEQVRQCNFFVVFARMAAINSTWVEKEVQYAIQYRKSGIAVKPWNYQGNIPKFISESFEIVGFNAPAILNKIETTLNGMLNR